MGTEAEAEAARGRLGTGPVMVGLSEPEAGAGVSAAEGWGAEGWGAEGWGTEGCGAGGGGTGGGGAGEAGGLGADAPKLGGIPPGLDWFPLPSGPPAWSPA
jgi:hypothetical protein